MELIKSEIQNANWKVKNVMQFTIDDTINVPDTHLDMDQLVLVKGRVQVDETQPMVDRFQIKGNLCYQILYCASQEQNVFDSMEGKIPFVEYINADGTEEGDYIEHHVSLSDLTVTMLHSRKINLKALIGLDYQVKNSEKLEVVTGFEDMPETTHILKDALSMMCLRIQKEEMMAVETSVQLPANKPDIYQVIWKSMTLTGTQVKPGDGYVTVSGNMCVFLIYTSEDEEMPMQYVTMEIPFEQQVDNTDITEDMISGCVVGLCQYTIHIAENENGEDRQLDIQMELNVEMKLYGLEELEIVRDMYGEDQQLLPQYKKITVQHLFIRNCAKTKVIETVAMPPNHTIMQICNVEGTVSVEETMPSARGIVVEGVVVCQLTYLDKEHRGTLSSATFDLPFTYEIEIPDHQDKISYSILPYMDGITAVQHGETKLDLKAEISLEVLAFRRTLENVMLDMEVQPMDTKQKKDMAAVIGYNVKQDDTLWSIAKQHYTTVERIMEINELESEEVLPGCQLVILKN